MADEAERRFRRHLEGVLGTPATEGNRIDVLRNGDEIFPSMFDAVEAAERTVDFLTFVYWEGRVGEELAARLCRRAEAGVRVRVLLDALGARTIDRALIDDMEAAGVDVRWFRPLHRFHLFEANHRTHRKVMVVDEAVAFTGGVGIADEWTGDARDESEWRDTHFRIQGPAVDGLRAAFLDNWSETAPGLFSEVDAFPEQPQPGHSVVQCIRGAAETGWSDIDILLRTLLDLAHHRIRITTAYFVPDEGLVEALCQAAARGVEIEILVPGPHVDKRFVQLAGHAVYDDLVSAGVRIWEFQPSMLHAKVMTVDGLVANIGSANINARSLAKDEEVNLVVLDPELVATLDAHFDDDLRRSERVDPARWRERPLPQRLLERLVLPLRSQS
ncbi:MAG: cardiolipin synthase B [Microthrixaceae bacterium]|nr:cardiolipin synthase B [Microthrixaceae bacterium]